MNEGLPHSSSFIVHHSYFINFISWPSLLNVQTAAGATTSMTALPEKR
jgi:hypothetical protein